MSLCRVEPANPRCPLTKFLSGCHKILRDRHGIHFIVSFSDPEHNEFRTKLPDKDGKPLPYASGGIYKAGVGFRASSSAAPKCFFPPLPDAPDSKHVGKPFPNPEAADLWRARFTLRMPRLSPAAPSLLEGFDCGHAFH